MADLPPPSPRLDPVLVMVGGVILAYVVLILLLRHWAGCQT